MKSLKIIDKLLEKIHQYDEWYLTEMEVEQIQQDLEVLEILRENLYLWYTRYWNEEIEIHTKLTTYTKPEEFKRVKQWLEENENE